MYINYSYWHLAQIDKYVCIMITFINTFTFEETVVHFDFVFDTV